MAEELKVFFVGQRVKKIDGDYVFFGTIRAVFLKGSGAQRYVVENADGILHIFSSKNLLHE